MTAADLKVFLESSYALFNKCEYIDPDPLLLPREYGETADREIAALVASCLAVGRAPLIAAAARDILSRMGNAPRLFVDGSDLEDMRRAFAGFRYRFFSGDDIAALLTGVKELVGSRGSLGGAFSSFVKSGDETVLGALSSLAGELVSASPAFAKNLLPSPVNGSACKRPLLFLRWMIRRDDVDPGGWDEGLVPLLVQPMDTHMSWVASRFGFAPCLSAANLKTAVEVTRRFRELSPSDPVKFDFCLTRPGIHPELSRDDWFSAC